MEKKTWRNIAIGGAVAIVGYVGVSFAMGTTPIFMATTILGEIFSIGNPKPAIEIELNEEAKAGDFKPNRLANASGAGVADGEWASYNRTVYGDRYSPLTQINAENASDLQVICEYDTKVLEALESSFIVIGGKLVLSTAEDIIAIDPTNCNEIWRVHESSGYGSLPTNRGVGYTNGIIARGYWDGYVRAYDINTGEKLWETFIGDDNRTIWLTASAVGWNDMFFYGTAGGDMYDIRGRVFGLDAKTGEVKWQTFTVPQQPEDTVHGPLGQMPTEQMNASWGNPPNVPISGGGTWTSFTIDPEKGIFYVPIGNPAPDYVKSVRPGANFFASSLLALDAKTGDYVTHYSIMDDDWHDWDVSNPPILVTSRAGKDLLTFAPKDGYLYSYNRANDAKVYNSPVTKMLNGDVEFVPGEPVYFCPGSTGGGEWNGAAFDPKYNLVFTGENEVCTTAKIKEPENVEGKPLTGMWFGVAYVNPYHLFGIQDGPDKWGGWLYATDADSGDWKWRARTNYPILSAVTPTAGDIVAFGDIGGTFRVLRSSDGKQLYSQKFDAMAGALVTYEADQNQYIAFATGLAHPQWPVAPTVNKVIIMGLKNPQ